MSNSNETLLKRQRVLAGFGDFALQSEDLDEVLHEACRLVGEALGTGRAKVLEIEEGGETLFVRAGVGWASDVVGQVRLRMAEHSSESFAIEAGEPVIMRDVRTEDRFEIPEFMKRAGIVALANVPIFLPGRRAYGLLQVDDTEPRDFDGNDSEFLRTYASLLGPVIDRLFKLQALRTSEERFRLTVEAATDYAIFVADAEDRITDWLPGAEAVFGWSTEEIKGQPAAILFTPEDREAGVPKEEVGTARKEGSAPNNREHLRRDGSRVFIEGTVRALHDDQGQPAGFIKIGQDVSERMRAEAALRESEAKYRTLFETMGQGYCELELVRDAGGRAVDQHYLELNPAFERLFGIPVAEARGRRASEVFPELEPSWHEAFDRVARTGTPERIEHEVASHARWFEVFAYPRGGDRLVVLYEDITDRKRAETVLRESELRQTFLLGLSDTLRPLSDPRAAMMAACRLLGEALNADRVNYAEVEGEDYVVSEEHRRAGLARMAGRYPIASFRPAERAAFEAGRTVALADIQAEPGIPPEQARAYAALGVRAFVSVPLVREGRLVVVLGVIRSRPGDWTQAEVALIEETAERTWAAVERARAEAAVRAGEERLRAILETAQDYAIFTTDAEGRIETWPRGAQEVFGWTEEEAVGQMVDITFTPEDRAAGAPEQERREARGTGQALNLRWHVRKDGSRVFIEGISRPIPGPGGAVTGFLKVGQDVTERRATEAALRESEERFRGFAEASSDVLWIIDAAGRRLEYLSPAYEAIWGEGRDGVMADLGRWAELVLPEDLPRVRDALDAALSGRRTTVEYRIRRPDNTLRYIHDTGFPILGEDGQVRRAAGISQDFTARRRNELALQSSQRRLRTLMEDIPQLVWRAVGHGQWTWASPQWSDFTGQSEEASHGWGWLEALHPDDRDAAREAWERSRTTGRFEADYRLREAATGEHRWFQTRATPVHDEAGRIVEWLGTSTDVQDIRELQERQGVLVAELQHRTRNLLAVVRGVMDKTRRQSGSFDTFVPAFDARLKALGRVQGLLSRLSGQGRISFDELIRAELAAVGATNPEGGGERVTLDGPTDVRLQSSTVQTFALALHELATNAVKYGALAQPAGRLAVRWRLLRDGGEPRLHVAWTETGVSMPDSGIAPQGGGYGRELIERALPYQLGAETTYELAHDGVRCTIVLPVSSTMERDDA